MADRVAFATSDINTSAEDSSKFNGFTEPSIFSDLDQYHTKGFSRSDLVKMLWRIKKWRAQGTFGSSTYDFEIVALDRFDFGQPATRERNIYNAFGGIQTEPDVSVGIEIYLGYGGIAGGVIFENGGLVYPSFEVYDYSGASVANETVAHSGGWDGDWGMTRTFTGYPTLSITVTPIEYWPYAATDGSPIYDTTTGALLQDPRN